ncbi:META domain-containing protein [Aureibacter tunicatorum]|uniref:META domain-containing protein n=1 Tax=Aureibacter tunicatorum TaxID=866807 RepID=A0AAE3XTB8_9BACT|nr:hypothetical protein [Aureibacter tunicatorum]MDR6241635.1 hypothetical protein [Aureibacter tunicatorum]BDD07249.1 hypothetical protein AUTU_47320 [Aureibacter tunicatorum]
MRKVSFYLLALTMLFLASCNGSKNVSTNPEDLKGEWVLVYNLSKGENPFTLEIMDNRYSLKANNIYNGELLLEDKGKIKFVPGISTKMMDTPDERKVTEMIFAVNQFYIDNGKLILTNSENPSNKLTFEKEAK